MNLVIVTHTLCMSVCVFESASTHYQRLIVILTGAVRRDVRLCVVLKENMSWGDVLCVLCGSIQLTNAISHVDEWIST